MAVHLLVILGVDFAPEERERRALRSLDVLLVRVRAPAPAEETSYVAEADREGGRESAGPPPSPPPRSAPLPEPGPDPLPAPPAGAGGTEITGKRPPAPSGGDARAGSTAARLPDPRPHSVPEPVAPPAPSGGAATRPAAARPPAGPALPEPAAPAGTVQRRAGRDPVLAQSLLSREHRVDPAPPSPLPEEGRGSPPPEADAGSADPGEATAVAGPADTASATEGAEAMGMAKRAGAAEGSEATDRADRAERTQAAEAADPGAVTDRPRTRETRTSRAGAPSAAELRAQVIESLSAALDERLQAYAERPRRKWITAGTREHAYAAYMEAWRRKVERVGNLNYPNEARRRGLSGTLSLDVALNADGSVAEVLLRRSSGERVLDEAALRIVELAAPFARFPAAILEEVDVLHIERTWVFSSRNEFNSR